MRRILCLHLPEWPIQRLCAADRGLDPRAPLVLHQRDPRRGQIVCACNAAARQAGVRLQMPLAEAAALVARQAAHNILAADDAADRAALAHLAEYCERFSPLVGWETAGWDTATQRRAKAAAPTALSGSPDCLLLDVTGTAAVFGGEEALAQEAIHDLAQRGYQARLAIADTIGAAWAFAAGNGAANEDLPQSPQRAPRPSWRIIPAGALRFQPSSLKPQASSLLPVRALRLPDDTVDLLAQLGVMRLNQLLVLPRAGLAARFGEILQLRIDQLLGEATETIVPHRPPPEFIAERRLEYPATSRELIDRIVVELLGQVAAQLAERREGALRLSCRLAGQACRPMLLMVGLFRPSAEATHLAGLLRMQLEQTILSGPVDCITLAAPLTAPLENRQGELFGGSQHEAARQRELLIDRLSSRLGPDAVLCPRFTADPVPERAVRYVPLVRLGQQRRASKAPLPLAAHRPLVLHSPPQALEVLAIAPGGPPASFRLNGQKQRVTAAWGPERIESGWWRGASVRRDYYRVETATGQRYWLFRRLPGGQWFLHGEFG